MSLLLRSAYLFPTLMILISLGASIRYAVGGEYGKALYWFCAVGLTFSVTFLMGPSQ